MPLVSDIETPPIVGSTPIVPAPVISIAITSPSNHSLATDNRWVPRMNLVSHAEGFSWVIDYYSQVLNSNSQLSGQQVTVSAPYQQYTKINQLEVKVSNPLTTSQDAESMEMVVTGTAILPPFMIPNQGDMFIADIGEGSTAIFLVESTRKLSIYAESAYEITYSLNSQDSLKYIDLDQKVIKQTYYHDKFVALGKNPIILADKHSILVELEQAYQTLMKQYFKKFFSKEYKTLILPAQDTIIYDHFLIDYILSSFTTWDTQEIRDITKLNVNDDDIMSSYSIWTAIKNKDISYLNSGFKTAGVAPVTIFSNMATSYAIRYSGIKKVIYPLDPVLSVDNTMQTNIYVAQVGAIVEAPASAGQLNLMARASNLRTLPASNILNSIPLVTEDSYYVFTQKFYDNTPSMTVLEGITYNYINGVTVDNAQLLDTAKLFTKWGLLEQFYYVPIILTLIKSSISGE